VCIHFNKYCAFPVGIQGDNESCVGAMEWRSTLLEIDFELKGMPENVISTLKDPKVSSLSNYEPM